ncbi:B12-binding domain-containing protein [Chloroflexota bacterium]
MGKQLVEAISELQEDEALRLVKEALDKGEDPSNIMVDCQVAMNIVGDRYESSEYFLPELIMSGHILEKISEIVKPKMQAETATKGGHGRKGKIVLGTVNGDVHDIGKDIVKFLLDVNGFEVHDLGVDVPEEKFVQTIQEVKPQVVALSGLLSAAYDSMESTIEAIKKAGLRHEVKIMIGGGMMDQLVTDHVGADAYGKDAMAAVTLAGKWIPDK